MQHEDKKKNKGKQVTSISIPCALSERHPGLKLRSRLEEFICTTEKERKTISVGERNFEVKNAKYLQLDWYERTHCRTRSIRLSPMEKQTLKEFTGERFLHKAVIVALCAMEILDKKRQDNTNTPKPQTIIPMSPYMGMKSWFVDKNGFLETILDGLKANHPSCTQYNIIDTFMGSGILAENFANSDYFNSVTGNYYDTTDLNYFQTICAHTATFKCLVLCLDSAASPEGNKRAKDGILDSLNAMKPDKAGKLLDVLEFFLKQNKVMKTSSNCPDIRQRVSWIIERAADWKRKTGKKPRTLHEKADNIVAEAEALEKIRITNMDALKLLKRYAGKPEYILVCDPPYFDTREYDESFPWESHVAMEKLLRKHAKKNGAFLYFGRPTAPRSLNTKASIDYSQRDKIYEGKYDDLFRGKGYFYLDYEFDKAHGIIERIVTNIEGLKGFSPYE